MDRRSFMRQSALRAGALVTASTAFGSLVGCMGGGDNSQPAIQPLPATFPGSSTPLPSTAAATVAIKFPQSVASGDPRSDSITLWTRAVPTSADDIATSATDANFTVHLRVTSSDNSAALSTTGALSGNFVVDADVPVYAFYDNTLRHRVTGLNPGTVYYYQFSSGSNVSRIGRFKTAPADGTDVAQLNFGFITCQDWSVNHWGAMSALAQENLDFVIHLGDYIYEAVGANYQVGGVEAAHPALKFPDGAALPTGGTYAMTTRDYRYLYKSYRSDARQQAVHERFAYIAIWDDHEFSDDCWEDRETYDNGTFNAATGIGDNTHQTSRRLSATQAWFEYMPADVSLSLDPGLGINNLRIFRDLKFGNLMHLVMTDERLYRADHMVPEAAVNPATGLQLGAIGARYMVPESLLYGTEAKKIAAATAEALPDPLTIVSMLGSSQRQWFLSTLQGSTAQWKIWGNEVSLLRMAVDGTKLPTAPAAFQQSFILDADQWDGYNAERKQIMAFIKANKISNVVAVTGDIHAFFSGVVMDDYTSASPTPVMVDLVTAGISSNSNFSYYYAAASQPAFSAILPLVATSQAGAEGIAIQMLSAGIAMAAGITDLTNTAAIQAAVGAAIKGGLISAAAVTPTAGLSSAVINTFNESLNGNMGGVIAQTIAGLAATGASVPAMTLYGSIQQKLAAALQIPASMVPASEIVKRLNPFANSATGVPPAVNNPWIRYVDSDAQGYSVVTLTKSSLVCQFKKAAPLVNGAAPASPISAVKTMTVTSGVIDVKVS